MRKLVATGLSIALAGTLFTGCMKMDGSIVVNTDGSCALSTEINIEKDAMLAAYTKLLNEDGGGDGFTKEQAAVMLEQYGIKLVKIDNKDYYKISSDITGKTQNNKFDNITSYYKSLAGISYQTEDSVLSLSETSVTIRQPANANVFGKLFAGNMEDNVASMLKGDTAKDNTVKDSKTDNVEEDDGSSDGPDKVVPWDDEDKDEYIDDEDNDTVKDNDSVNAVLKLFEDKEIMAGLKTATMTYKVTFATKIKERSSNTVVSADGKTISVTLPLITDKTYNEYAVCENDIGVTGAMNGVTYKKAVTVTIPENVTATLNGNEVLGQTVICDKTGTYNFRLSDGKKTTKTLCFMVDNTAPSVTRQKDVNKAEFGSFYEGQEAFLNNGYIAVYDAEGGVADIIVDGNSVIKDASVNTRSNEDKNSLVSQYYIYSLDTMDFEEGSHAINVSDTLGNSSEEEFIIDRTKPSVKGVKNGKTYKKAVKIKISDQNGIKSAVLNGKPFRQGSKTSKNGSYILKVTDNAGNVKTVKFKIKK